MRDVDFKKIAISIISVLGLMAVTGACSDGSGREDDAGPSRSAYSTLTPSDVVGGTAANLDSLTVTRLGREMPIQEYNISQMILNKPPQRGLKKNRDNWTILSACFEKDMIYVAVIPSSGATPEIVEKAKRGEYPIDTITPDCEIPVDSLTRE